MLKQTMNSPVGMLFISIEAAFITNISYDESTNWEIIAGEENELKLYMDLKRQLEAYFKGELEQFDLPLSLTGTPFQKRVWQALSEVEYGEVVSYKDIAFQQEVRKQSKRWDKLTVLIQFRLLYLVTDV